VAGQPAQRRIGEGVATREPRFPFDGQ
jgi:hypothetical protein